MSLCASVRWAQFQSKSTHAIAAGESILKDKWNFSQKFQIYFLQRNVIFFSNVSTLWRNWQWISSVVFCIDETGPWLVICKSYYPNRFFHTWSSHFVQKFLRFNKVDGSFQISLNLRLAITQRKAHENLYVLLYGAENEINLRLWFIYY